MRISTPERYQRQSLKKSEGDFHRLYQVTRFALIVVLECFPEFHDSYKARE